MYASPVYASPVYASPVYASPVYASGADPHATAHCRDTNPCTCEPPASASSLVYPHPIFAKLRYTPQGALRYQMTGTRPSQAKPLYGVQAPGPTDAGWATTGVVRIAVVDTGWPASGALATVASTSEGDFIDAPDAEFDGYLDPVAGHGTFIAGLLAQRAPDCAVAVFHALSTYGDGAESAIATCIQDLACRPSETRPHFLSLSFGTYTPDDEEPGVLREAIQHAILKGIIVVASAGNDGTSRRSYPAAFPGVVSVGALGPSGPASFSNWGDWVRACAPGVDVSSSFWFFNGAQQAKFGADADDYHGWALWSGTSFAAPIVTAALADAVHHGVPIKEVVSRTIDYPGLYRIPCYGTVVNPPIKQLGKLP